MFSDNSTEIHLPITIIIILSYIIIIINIILYFILIYIKIIIISINVITLEFMTFNLQNCQAFTANIIEKSDRNCHKRAECTSVRISLMCLFYWHVHLVSRNVDSTEATVWENCTYYILSPKPTDIAILPTYCYGLVNMHNSVYYFSTCQFQKLNCISLLILLYLPYWSLKYVASLPCYVS